MKQKAGFSGKVVLVGAGPGDAGLLTLRGRAALENADVVLYDRLVGDEVLSMIPARTERIDVGKNSGNHPIPQDKINAILLEKARDGKTVVRLKGGDPYLFGRGAEELESLILEGVDFEVVPGITSALAVPAYAGIPLTHRDFSSSVHIMTGHAKAGAPPDIDYESLVRLRGTFVFVMGLTTLSAICGGLLGAGMDPETPAAIIENGTRPHQRKLVATVSTLAESAPRQGFSPPSLVVVGDVCALSERIDWFSRMPLSGVGVLVTRPKPGCALMSEKLRALGCGVTEYPCIETVPVNVPESLFENIGRYDWAVFTSAVGVKLFFDGLVACGRDVRALAGVKLAAIGGGTAREMLSCGAIADFVPDEYSGAKLAEGLASRVASGERLLLFRAAAGGDELPQTLLEHGFAFDDVGAYETLYKNADASGIRSRLESGGFDYVTFTSASTVTGFARSMQGLDLRKVNGVCIGEKTAACAKEYGINTYVSEAATIDSMIGLIRSLAKNGGKIA